MTPEQERAWQRIADADLKIERARAALKREQDRKDTLVAINVSAQPESLTWYLHPGLLSAEEAMGAGGLTEKALASAVERHRKRTAPKPKAGTKARRKRAVRKAR